MTGAFFVVGVSCWYLLKRRETKFALESIKVAIAVAIVAVIGVMVTGDTSGIQAAKYQPMKLAAAEGLENGGPGAPFSVVPGIEVPKVLSILATHDIEGHVPGINDLLYGYTTPDGEHHPSAEEKIKRGKEALAAFKQYRATMKTDPATAAEARKKLDENVEFFGYGYLDKPEDLVPPVPIVYWAFRIMVGLLWLGILGIPAVYLAGQAGWVVAEVGRQPWAIQDLLPVNAAISSLSVANVVTTFFIFLVLFTILLIVEIRIMLKAIKKGPDFA